MKVQTRLSLFSTLVFGIIFAIISVMIYGLYRRHAIRSVYDNLKKTSLITAIFYLEEDELNSEEFSKAQKQFEEFVSNSYYQIYNEAGQVSYGNPSLDVSSDILNKIRGKERFAFQEKEFLCYGIFYEDNQGDFVVISREKRETINHQLQILLWILILAFILGITAITLFSRWIANKAYRPFRIAIKQVNTISTDDLNKQIKIPNTQDELQDLIVTFNKLLAKISETFIIQKNFISYVSHEFKTPLASIMGNLEVFSLKDRSPEEYKQLTHSLVQQIKELEQTLNTLLIISDLRNESEMSQQVRLDEIIWEIISKLSQQYRKTNIHVNIEVPPEKEHLLSVSIDRTQLLMALFNLIENAVKYSWGKQVDILLYNVKGYLAVSITDTGIGIPQEQLSSISRPFYRADNTYQIQGSGIGLSIAFRILEKNGIEYNINSTVNIGTTIQLLFTI